jgi:hypothetical protein
VVCKHFVTSELWALVDSRDPNVWASKCGCGLSLVSLYGMWCFLYRDPLEGNTGQSTVGIVTCYVLDDPGIESLWG